MPSDALRRLLHYGIKQLNKLKLGKSSIVRLGFLSAVKTGHPAKGSGPRFLCSQWADGVLTLET